MPTNEPPKGLSRDEWNRFVARSTTHKIEIDELNKILFSEKLHNDFHKVGKATDDSSLMKIEGYDFSGCVFKSSLAYVFSRCTFRRADFRDISLRRCRFVQCLFQSTIFECNLESVCFEDCSFVSCDLSTSDVNFETTFPKCHFDDTIFSRSLLEDLGHSNGSLTVGQIRDLIIADPVADLRRSFSGFQSVLYFTLGVIAFFPYIWFVISQLRLITVGQSLPVSDKSSPIYQNLARFIWSGGHNWRHWEFAPLSVLTLLYSTVFNLMRMALLWKTKYLEHLQSISGFTPNFDTRGWWAKCFQVHNVMKYGVVLVVLLHTLLFLSTRVPLEP